MEIVASFLLNRSTSESKASRFICHIVAAGLRQGAAPRGVLKRHGVTFAPRKYTIQADKYHLFPLEPIAATPVLMVPPPI